MPIISKENFSRASGTGKIPGLAALLMKLIKIDDFNKLIDRAGSLEGVEFAQFLLNELGITIEIDEKDLCNIPANGAFIAIANHPYGAIESLALLLLLSGQRPDTKFMGNFLLKKVPNLAEYIIAVNPFEKVKDTSSISGLKSTLRLLQDGVPVAIFPAGEVSSFCCKNLKITDRQWHPVVGKIIAKADVPVLPVYFEGTNGIVFSLLRYIHPSLQTAMLPGELFNKKGHILKVRIGQPVCASQLSCKKSNETLLRDLRNQTYGLSHSGKKPQLLPSLLKLFGTKKLVPKVTSAI